MVTISKSKPISTQKGYVGDPVAFKMMIDIAPDPIIMIKDKKVIYGNKKAIKLIEYSEKELIGSDFLKFISKDDHTTVISNYIARMTGFNTNPIYEINILTKSGLIIPSEVNALQIKYFGETVDFIIIRDITLRKKQEALLRAEKEEALKLNKLLSGRELKMIELKEELETLKKEIILLKSQLKK